MNLYELRKVNLYKKKVRSVIFWENKAEREHTKKEPNKILKSEILLSLFERFLS